MISFGRIDINRLYYLICLNLVSKEETIYYYTFYEAFKSLCVQFNMNCSMTYLNQDACQAEAAGAFPNTIIFTCYFHVMKNVRKR